VHHETQYSLTDCSIEKFGGDPKRMILFGQSAGGASVDFYAYSYTKDPIVYGFIPQSGTAGLTSRTPAGTGNLTNNAAVNWSNLSEKLGCGAVTGVDVTKTLSCMRSKSVDAVLDATIPKSSAAAVGSSTSWGPKLDDKTVFADTSAKGAKGDFIKAVRPLSPHLSDSD
jgi:cholinesterase